MKILDVVEGDLNFYIITYDLGEPYDHDGVNRKLTKIGAKPLDNTTTWILKSADDIDTVRDQVARLFRPVDEGNVFQISEFRKFPK